MSIENLSEDAKAIINRKSLVITRLWIIIVLLILILAIIIYFILAETARQNFRDNVANKDSYHGIDDYRSRWNGSIYAKTKGVYYDPEDVRKYIVDTFPKLTGDIKLQPNCKWVVGFYFMRTKNRNKDPRNSFYVIPTMVDTVKGEIHDFFIDTAMYKIPSTTTATRRTRVDSLAYNAGELWP